MALIYFYITPLLLAGAVAAVLAVVAARRSGAPGASMLSVLMVASAIWAFGYALELWAPAYPAKLFWAKVQYIGIVVVAPAWLIFSVQYAQQNRWLCRDGRRLGLLGIIPAVTLLLVWTNDAHGLLWRSAILVTDGPFPMLVVDHGSWFWLYAFYSYILLMIGTVWVASTFVRSRGIVRKQAAAVLLGMIPVWLANAIYLGVENWAQVPGIDPTPFGLALMGIIGAWALWRLHLMDIVPAAHSSVIGSMAAGVIVLDLHNHIIEMNPVAQKLARAVPAVAAGTMVGALLANHAPLVTGDSYREELMLDIDGVPTCFEVHATLLRDDAGQALGRVLVFHDATRWKQAEGVLQEFARTLEQRVSERTQALQLETARHRQTAIALAGSEARQHAMLQAIPDMLLRIRSDGTIVDLKPGEGFSLGVGGETAISRTLTDLSLDELWKLLRPVFAEVEQTGHVHAFDYASLGGDGTRHFRIRVAGGGSDEYICIFEDVTLQRRAERQLRYHANLLRSVSDAVISTDNEFRIVSWNEAASRIYGYSAEEVQGRVISEVLATAYLDASSATVMQSYTADGYWEGEAIHRHKNGAQINVWSSVTAIADYANNPIGSVAVDRDMTTHRTAIMALRESEMRYRNLVESSQDLIESVGPDGRLLFVNRAWLKQLEYTQEDVPALSLWDVIHPSERDHCRQIFGRLLAGETEIAVQTRFCTRTGQELVVEGTALGIHENGRLAYTHTFLRNITRSVVAEAARQRAEQRYHRLFEDAPVMYILTGAKDGIAVVSDCNMLFLQTLGYTHAEVIGQPVERFCQPRLRSAPAESQAQLFDDEECVLVTSKDERVEALVRYSAEPDADGNDAGGRVTFIDIRERKQTERLLKQTTDQLRALATHMESVREEERTQIAREIHDELGQKLTALKMDVAWLARRLDAKDEILHAKLKAIFEIISAIIGDVQRISAELRPGLLDNLGLVAAMEWLAQNFERRLEISCSFTYANEQGEADIARDLSTALFRIAQEALTNVARHAQAAHAAIHLGITPREITLVVSDDGVGIRPANLTDPHAFGLIGMRERLYPWQGELVISGAKNQGTTVTVIVPTPKEDNHADSRLVG